jgi:hypothetical protein
MIRTRSGDAVLLGVDAENLRRLAGGEPIFCDFDTFGGPAKRVVIVYGETMEAIIEQFKKDGLLPPDFDPGPIPQQRQLQ